MKRKRVLGGFLSLLALVLLPLAVANPLVPGYLNELMLKQDSWILEVETLHMGSENTDGWSISSRSGQALFKTGMGKGGGYLLVTPDSLQAPVSIDPAGDSVTVTTSKGYRKTVVFGPGPNCDVQAPHPGWSIAFRQFFCLDSSPTLGAANDTTGAMAQISGSVVDSASGKPLAGVTLSAFKLQIISQCVTDSSGKFAARFFAHNFSLWGTLQGYRGATLSISLIPGQAVDTVIRLASLTAVEEQPVPATALLFRSYPNPFNPSTTIVYELPAAGKVLVRICDLQGREVVDLVRGFRAPGVYRTTWNGRDQDGDPVGTGIYLARLELTGPGGERNASKTIKLLLLH